MLVRAPGGCFRPWHRSCRRYRDDEQPACQAEARESGHSHRSSPAKSKFGAHGLQDELFAYRHLEGVYRHDRLGNAAPVDATLCQRGLSQVSVSNTATQHTSTTSSPKHKDQQQPKTGTPKSPNQRALPNQAAPAHTIKPPTGGTRYGPLWAGCCRPRRRRDRRYERRCSALRVQVLCVSLKICSAICTGLFTMSRCPPARVATGHPSDSASSASAWYPSLSNMYEHGSSRQPIGI